MEKSSAARQQLTAYEEEAAGEKKWNEYFSELQEKEFEEREYERQLFEERYVPVKQPQEQKCKYVCQICGDPKIQQEQKYGYFCQICGQNMRPGKPESPGSKCKQELSEEKLQDNGSKLDLMPKNH